MRNRKNLWNGYTSSISGELNRNIDNSYLTLEEEPENPYDKNAIRVVCRGEFYGTVGYVGREYALQVKEILKTCQCYRVDMVDEAQAGEREVKLVLVWK
ncbi:MAG: HIRAN domain-containing protein [Firmicutes bacterium]|nr:HIRAN domain-containing protein [Bacillota bacterium]